MCTRVLTVNAIEYLSKSCSGAQCHFVQGHQAVPRAAQGRSVSSHKGIRQLGSIRSRHRSTCCHLQGSAERRGWHRIFNGGWLLRVVQALENRTLDSKREMDIMNALDEMKSLKARQERVNSEALLSALKRSGDEEEVILEEADEAAVRPVVEIVFFLPALLVGCCPLCTRSSPWVQHSLDGVGWSQEQMVVSWHWLCLLAPRGWEDGVS